MAKTERKLSASEETPDFSGQVIWASQEGINLLEQQIQTVLKEQEKTLKQLGEVANGGHDLPDNIQFKELMVELRSTLPRRLNELRKKQLKTIFFQEALWFKNHDFQTITLGTRVTVRASDSNKTETYDLLGPIEAEAPNRAIMAISFVSPLGKALLGHKDGDIVSLESGLRFKIVKTEQVVFPIKN